MIRLSEYIQNNSELLPSCVTGTCVYTTEQLQKVWIYCCKVYVRNNAILEHTNSIFLSPQEPLRSKRRAPLKKTKEDNQGKYLYIYLDNSHFVNQVCMYKDFILNIFKDSLAENIIDCEILLSKHRYKDTHIFDQGIQKKVKSRKVELSSSENQLLQNILQPLQYDKELYYATKHAFEACLCSQE